MKTNIIIILIDNNICHTLAGNLAICAYQGQHAIWYGRVTPYHCLDIIQQLVVESLSYLRSIHVPYFKVAV